MDLMAVTLQPQHPGGATPSGPPPPAQWKLAWSQQSSVTLLLVPFVVWYAVLEPRPVMRCLSSPICRPDMMIH